jgi:hypothetical protein
VTCTSGTVSNGSLLASEGAPAVFSITGASPGTTCTAVENSVPSGYSADQSDCQQAKLLNGGCTIVNTANPPGPDQLLLDVGFEEGNASGWSVDGSVGIDSSVAIGNYSLRHEGGGATSTRHLSTEGFSNISVTMHLAAKALGRNDTCIAELSADGGNSWMPVLELDEGSANGVFRSGTLYPQGASNNPDLWLRFTLTTRGRSNGETCWGDEVVVMGTPMAQQQGTGGNLTSTPKAIAELDEGDSGLVDALHAGGADFAFDPGFDNLFGNGAVVRRHVSADELLSGQAPTAAPAWTAFNVPHGAAQPDARFEGWLSITGATETGMPLNLHVAVVQEGNHLFPVARADAQDDLDSGWDHVFATGRAWQESGDNGLSRASLPFVSVQRDTGCFRSGAMSFLFDDDGSTSSAVYRLAADSCSSYLPEEWGAAMTYYLPTAVGDYAGAIESVLSCAATEWLPLVQNRGGFTMLLTPDSGPLYALDEGNRVLFLGAITEGVAISDLCR